MTTILIAKRLNDSKLAELRAWILATAKDPDLDVNLEKHVGWAHGELLDSAEPDCDASVEYSQFETNSGRPETFECSFDAFETEEIDD